MSEQEKTRDYVPYEQEKALDRLVMIWVNTWPDKPAGTIRFTQLDADAASMAVFPEQSPYITRRYITGGYRAVYSFELVYRVKPGTSDDARLRADEALNSFGSWAAGHPPAPRDGLRFQTVEPAGRAVISARYDNGDEDHRILVRLTYEVNENDIAI